MWDYAEVRDGGLCMQTGSWSGHSEVSASTLGPLPSEAGHAVGLSYGVDVWTEKMKMECNFWMRNFCFFSPFVNVLPRLSIPQISKYCWVKH